MNEVFKALSDSTRRQILELLKEGEMSAGELAQHFNLAKPTLSKHFQVLYEADLIWRDRRGTSIVYGLKLSVLEEAVLGLMNSLRRKS